MSCFDDAFVLFLHVLTLFQLRCASLQYTVSESTPSAQAIEANAEALARYAAISQQAGLVPIVEPEVLMAGDFTIQRSMEAHIAAYSVLFAKLALHKVDLAGLVLKASMVVCGDKQGKASPEEVGEGGLPILISQIVRTQRESARTS